MKSAFGNDQLNSVPWTTKTENIKTIKVLIDDKNIIQFRLHVHDVWK
jgi:hypothetical protein